MSRVFEALTKATGERKGTILESSELGLILILKNRGQRQRWKRYGRPIQRTATELNYRTWLVQYKANRNPGEKDSKNCSLDGICGAITIIL
jgi:hypothetical protein